LNKTREYLKNTDLLREIVECKKKGELSDKAVDMFRLIAIQSNRKLTYANEQDREDCIASAIEDMIRYWDGFDPLKGVNPFAYFTQMAKNGFAKGWNKLHPEGVRTVSLSFIDDWNMI
jgi:hypothetical protein